MRVLKLKQWHFTIALIGMMLFPVTLSAAQGRVKVKGNAITVRQALKQIEASSEYTFFYKAEDVDDVKNTISTVTVR